MSVVVPPMSTTMASSNPVKCLAPATLAAGPDNMVSTGRSLANRALISVPSPLTTTMGATSPSFWMVFSKSRIKAFNLGMILAFNMAV